MSDDTTVIAGNQGQQQGGAVRGVFVAARLREQFPELIEMILGSESMNDEERQYWIDILPVMTQEQVEQLRTILKNEKEQLAAIDTKYNQQIEQVAEQERPLKQITQERRTKKIELASKEEEARKKEEENAEDILKKMEDL